MTAPNLLARLRRPSTVDTVEVTFTGSPRAVVAAARALASVVAVTGMRHRVGDSDQVIRLEAVCDPAAFTHAAGGQVAVHQRSVPVGGARW